MAGFRRRGDKSADIDVLFQKSNRLKRDIEAAVLSTTNMMSDNMQQVGTARVQGTSTGATIIGRRRRKKGEFTTLGFFIDSNCTSVTIFYVDDPSNASPNTVTQIKAIASANRIRIDDITDDERMAGYMTREIGPLDFLTKFGIVRIVSRNDENGLVATIKDPEDSPYTQVPVAYIGVYDTPTTQVSNAFATWSTCDADGLNCGTIITAVVPRPHPPIAGVPSFIVSQKVTSRGVKPTFRIIVPKNTTRVALRLIRADEINSGSMIFEKAIRDEWEIASQDLSPVDPSVMAEPDARVFIGRFGKFLDFNATYNTIRVVCFGENVDAVGGEVVRNPMVSAAVLANGTFVAGASVENFNSLLKNDIPFVSMANGANGLPIDFILKKRGVKAMFHMLIPDTTKILTARITEVTGAADTPNSTLQDTWDDIVLPEGGNTGQLDIPSNSAQIRIVRKFGPTLDFNQTYRLKRLVAEGDNIGGPAVDKAVFVAPGQGMMPVTFTTPDSEGNFNPTGGTLAFVSIVARRFKRNGVFVKMRITIPRGTQRVICKIQNLADQNASDAKSKVLEYAFEDIDDAERSAGQFDREFGIKLDAAIPATDSTPVQPVTYGVVRLAAFGDNVNASGGGGKNPDVFRVPVANPTYPIPTGSYLGTFSTTRALGYVANDGVTFAVCPGQPQLIDLTNAIDNDAPAVTFRVFASQFRNGPVSGAFPAGTGAGGTVTMGDVGAEMAFVVVNRVGSLTNDNKIVAMAAITDFNSTFVDIEIPGLVEGKRYFIPRVGLIGSGETAKTQSANPQTSILFNAGFSIDVTLLQNLGITLVDALDTRNSNITFGYTVPISQNVLARNIILERDVIKPTGVITGYKEAGRIELKSDKDNGVAGVTRTFTLPETHPGSTPAGTAQIRYRVTVNPVKNGTGPINAIFPTNGTYIPVGQDAGMFMDPGRPQFVATPATMVVKWKPSLLRVKCNLPDTNMLTFVGAKATFYFSADLGIPFGTRNYFWNPNTNQTTQQSELFFPFDYPTFRGSPFYVDFGQAFNDSLDPDRPTTTSAGGLPQNIYDDLLQAFNLGRTATMKITVYFLNTFDLINISNSSVAVFRTVNFPFTTFVLG